MEKKRGVRKTRIGMVVSDKMDKTVVVEVKRLVPHPLYHKIMRRRVKIKAHDAANTCKVAFFEDSYRSGDLLRGG